MIVDDEQPAADRLAATPERHIDDIQIIAMAEMVKEAIELIASSGPNLVFALISKCWPAWHLKL